MANEKNLRPFRKGELSKEEATKRGSKGGKKSVQKRRERKALKEQLLLLLETGNAQEQLCTSLFEKALSGDVRAFEVIRDTIGEKPVDKVAQTDGEGNDVPKNDLSKIPTETLLKMAKAAGAGLDDEDDGEADTKRNHR
jgi:hypothetical protein